MAAKQKIDGVVEAVRYSPEGMIALVRLYPRIATTYADRVLWTREQLVKELRAKKHFVVGQRKAMWGATFNYGAPTFTWTNPISRNLFSAGSPTLITINYRTFRASR